MSKKREDAYRDEVRQRRSDAVMEEANLRILLMDTEELLYASRERLEAKLNKVKLLQDPLDPREGEQLALAKDFETAMEEHRNVLLQLGRVAILRETAREKFVHAFAELSSTDRQNRAASKDLRTAMDLMTPEQLRKFRSRQRRQ